MLDVDFPNKSLILAISWRKKGSRGHAIEGYVTFERIKRCFHYAFTRNVTMSQSQKPGPSPRFLASIPSTRQRVGASSFQGLIPCAASWESGVTRVTLASMRWVRGIPPDVADVSPGPAESTPKLSRPDALWMAFACC